MTLPELRFMQDRQTRFDCVQEAKHRVWSQGRYSKNGFSVFRYMIPLLILSSIFNRSVLMGILGTLAINACGSYVYWLVYRKQLRIKIREVIRELSEYCTACGFSTKGNISGTCPECGTTLDDELKTSNDQ